MAIRIRRCWWTDSAALVGGVVCASLLLTGCGEAGSGAVPGPVPAGSAAILHDAEQLLIRNCMRDKGFQYVPEPKNPVPQLRRFPYVVDDLAWARRYGYGSGLRRRLDDIAARNPNQAYFRTLSPARRQAAVAALNGPRPTGLEATLADGMSISHSDTGCTSDARRELYGDLAAWFAADKLVGSLDSARIVAVLSDGTYRTTLSAWARCMRAAGHPVPDPQQAQGRFADSRTSAPPRHEVAQAAAEATCAARSGLGPLAKQLDARVSADLAKCYAAAVETRRRLQHAALPQARGITARG